MTLEDAPDAFDPRLECGAWILAPHITGGPWHTHVCRREAAHSRTEMHACGCGHPW